MLTDLAGNPIEIASSAGPPQAEALSPRHAPKKVTAQDGASSSAYARFIARRRLQDGLLKKETANDQLVARAMKRLDAIDHFMADDEIFWAKMEKASLKDIAIMEGVYMDKIQSLRGQATQIIGIQHQEKLDQVLPLLLQTMQQRGLKLELTERKAEVTAS